MMNPYTCSARTEFGARCRNPVGKIQPGLTCSQHNSARAFATYPDTVLVKLKLTPGQEREVKNVVSSFVRRDFARTDAQHILDAQAVDRDAFRYRQNVPDSGVPVFGEKGIGDISLEKLPKEMYRAGYAVSNIHFEPSRDGLTMLVIVMVRTGEERELPQEVVDLLATHSWRKCHIWANPPKDGRVTHTVNLQRGTPVRDGIHLLFANGLWDY